jgi:hypothetical protein
MKKQLYHSREEIEEHLHAGTWTSLRSDDRVSWFHERGWDNMSVHSYLRSIGHKKEATQLWEKRERD